VRDLAESIDFYVDALGCTVGRVRDDFADVWFFGMQLTLHARPAEVVPADQQGVRHFGVTLTADEMRALIARAEACGATFATAVSTEYAGTAREQTKTKLFDPSGNVIEIKTYVDPIAALRT
jgi:hypothetical protein